MIRPVRALLLIVVTLLSSHAVAQTTADETAIRNIIAEQAVAWSAGDAAAYTSRVAADVSFTNLFGMVMYGKPAFDARHKEILATFFKGTTKKHAIRKIRFVTPDVAIVDIDNEVHGVKAMPAGVASPPDGVLKSQLMQVFVRRGGQWWVEAYHNVDTKLAREGAGPKVPLRNMHIGFKSVRSVPSAALALMSVLSAGMVLVSAPAQASFDSAPASGHLAQDKQVRTAYPDKRGFKLTDFPRTIKLADNVYGYEDIRNPGFTTVSLFVVGADGVLIADGQGSPEATRKMLDEIAKVTPKPVKWYIVGSDHGDHTAGNSALPKDITYVVSKASKEQMKLAAPAMLTDQEVINVGGIEVHAVYLGRAHTGGDLLVFLPKQRILFMSEVYLNRVFPAMRSAYPTEWVNVIDKALQMEVGRFVPGHGFIEESKASREELVEYQKALRAVIAEVTRLHKLGLSADEAAKQANWGPYKEWFLSEQQGPIAVRKIYEELEGKLK